MNTTFREENKLWKKGYRLVACVDEAGRGPLAGPVVAAAVIANSSLKSQIPNVKDSKKLTPQKREEIFKIIKNHSQVKWAAGIVSEKVIDKINILEATKLAMKKALRKLKADFIILDGNFTLKGLNTPQKAIIKGDEKVFSCALASIIAKVTRDKIMGKYHKKYSQYGFDIHKGYPTKKHIAAIRLYGPCKIHRLSFAPLKNMIK
ncbi:MAG: ribonuclease HII [Candidatus Nealsonbacteria bacterium]|nr:ribonuclease HII [Candidatus Nealsonbacteria bacterium]